MSSAAALNQFLADVERRAFNMTRLTVGNTEDALDIVQDAMLTLAAKYAHKSPDDWRPLFFRILKNKTTDFHRRSGVYRKVFGWFRSPSLDEDEAELDPLAQVPAVASANPDERLSLDIAKTALVESVGALPQRQQQAFMLRCVEGMSTEQTASAMGCSQGSVKTHYSRALNALREVLQEHWT